MGRLGNWELAYVAARIGMGLWFLLRYLPMPWRWISDGLKVQTIVATLGTFLVLLQLLAGLVAGVCLLFGFKTREAAFIGAVLCFTMALPGMGAICIGLIGYLVYNRFALDARENDPDIDPEMGHEYVPE